MIVDAEDEPMKLAERDWNAKVDEPSARLWCHVLLYPTLGIVGSLYRRDYPQNGSLDNPRNSSTNASPWVSCFQKAWNY